MVKDLQPSSAANANKEPEVERELSQVATNPKQSILILVGVVLIFAYLFFNLFFSSDSNKSKDNLPAPNDISKPVQISADSDVPLIPSLPSPSTPSKLEDLTPPPPPPPAEPVLPAVPPPSLPPELPATPVIQSPSTNLPFDKVRSEDEIKKRQLAKRKSSIVLVAGTPPAKTPDQLQQEADFTDRGDMTLVLGRGKIIDAVIETAINSDFGGEIRAVISRDVYSEWGKNILLPKGSRIFGNYATGIQGAYGMISIEWTRIDLANGYSINLSGTGVDNLGRKGNRGRVDNKFRERFSNAVLRSAFNIGLAKGLDMVVKPQISSQTAASRTLAATNIKNIANGIFTQTGVTDAQKRVQICASVLSAIEDKTSTAFTQIQTACNNLATDATATDTAKLTSLLSTVNSSADSLIKNTTTDTEPSKAQEASKQAFTDISDTLKSFVEEQDFKPTITIDQGTEIKVYVNKDYKFPKNAVKKSGLIK